MAWTNPLTWVAGQTVTDAQLNTHIRDNLNVLRGSEFSNSVIVGNIGTGEDDLHTHTVSAGLLAVNGQMLRWDFAAVLANNANNKHLKVHFGSQSLTISNSVDANRFIVGSVWVVRLGATTQRMNFHVARLNVGISGDAVPTETLSGAIVMKFTGEATATNDIQQMWSVMEFIG